MTSTLAKWWKFDFVMSKHFRVDRQYLLSSYECQNGCFTWHRAVSNTHRCPGGFYCKFDSAGNPFLLLLSGHQELSFVCTRISMEISVPFGTKSEKHLFANGWHAMDKVEPWLLIFGEKFDFFCKVLAERKLLLELNINKRTLNTLFILFLFWLKILFIFFYLRHIFGHLFLSFRSVYRFKSWVELASSMQTCKRPATALSKIRFLAVAEGAINGCKNIV